LTDLKDKALTTCMGCGKLVPVTLYCLYCTYPILAEVKTRVDKNTKQTKLVDAKA